jgi:aminoglycoside 3-N-acetyltransferase
MKSFAPPLRNVRFDRGPLIVHCAFRPLAAAGYSAEAVIDALADVAGSEALLMPSMSWRAVTPGVTFDARHTPGITGHLGEVFRTQYASARSVHPTHSVSGAGSGVDWLLGEHGREVMPCSSASPFRRLVEADGCCLLINVGLERCTIFHCAEEEVGPDIYLQPDQETYRCIALDGAASTVVTRRHVKRLRDFEKFRSTLSHAGGLTSWRGDGMALTVVRAAAIFELVSSALKNDPYATFAAHP